MSVGKYRIADLPSFSDWWHSRFCPSNNSWSRIVLVRVTRSEQGRNIINRFSLPAQRMLMNIINGLLKFLASASYAIIYIYANELFPTRVRNTGMGICSMIARIGAIIGTVCNDALVNSSPAWSLHHQLVCFRHAFSLICQFCCTVVRRCLRPCSP